MQHLNQTRQKKLYQSSKLKILGIVIARGGSKELPKKNLLKIGKLTLVERSIYASLNSKCITRSILSTDSKEIIKKANKTKIEIPFLRPSRISTDKSSAYHVMNHSLNWLRKQENYIPDVVVLLQSTTPFRTGHHIDSVVSELIKSKADCVISITNVEYPANWMLIKNKNNKLNKLINDKDYSRRQDAPLYYKPSGMVYAYNLNFLLSLKGMLPQGDTRGVFFDREVSINIDSALDYEIAKTLYQKTLKKP
jgi:CMP-N,N'-diacetyllegionaminic acid synthase